MTPVRTTARLLAAVLAALSAPVAPASAYQIDCAILLCIAGGFPPSAPCAAARAEMIRRITPWPIEPPLQLWRCPMHVSFSPWESEPAMSIIPVALTTASRPSRSLPVVTLAYDSAIESYLSGIKVYDLTYRRHRNHDGDCNVTVRFTIGSYDPSGAFNWRRAAVQNVPAWVFDTSYSQCSEALFRGVGLEWRDYEGRKGTEVVRY